VLRLLEKDPEARPAGAAAVLDALRALAAGAARPEAPLPAPSVEPERSWSERIAAARELLGLAHPHGIPSWVSAALQAAVADAEELVRLRAELDRSAERLRREDPATREARVQLGAAVEVLARDEARCLRELEQLRGPLEEHRARAAALGPALQAAWAGLPAAPGTLSVPMAELLRNVGQLAGMWLEAARAVETLDAERSRCEREREDLRYQLVHLEGRLAALGSDLRAEPLEHAATQVEGRLVEALRQVADHLAHSPALAERARRLLT
jgi:chromosome segregation ATPase